MKKIVKFSKSYKNIIHLKADFFVNNEFNLKLYKKIYNYYRKQPVRKYCKNCGSKKIKSFIKNFQIPYKLCSHCGHLNGAYQDTNNFAKKLYNDNDGKNYSRNYNKDYNLRVKNIYSAKVEFLKKIIKEEIEALTEEDESIGSLMKDLGYEKARKAVESAIDFDEKVSW